MRGREYVRHSDPSPQLTGQGENALLRPYAPVAAPANEPVAVGQDVAHSRLLCREETTAEPDRETARGQDQYRAAARARGVAGAERLDLVVEAAGHMQQEAGAGTGPQALAGRSGSPVETSSCAHVG